MSAGVARGALSLAGVAAITGAAQRISEINATTIGFAYLILILLIASTWGFTEAASASVAATLAFNYFFLPPVGTFTISDPQNWVALFTFLTTSLVASRLSTRAKERALDALNRQKDLERLYTFSRAILLIDATEPFPKQLVLKLADIFELQSAVLLDRRSGLFYRAGPSEAQGVDERLREAALAGTFFSDPGSRHAITAVRLGSEPIGSLALYGDPMPDSVLQGIANLVAIGLERARAQSLAHQVEAAQQSEQLRTTLIDAMAHELKTPLTSIRAATTSLLSSPDQPEGVRLELLRIADEEAEHLRGLIDGAVEMARLDTAQIEVHLHRASIARLADEVIGSLGKDLESRVVTKYGDDAAQLVPADERLIRLALKQLINNALKYSAVDSPVTVEVQQGEYSVICSVTDHGIGIPSSEQGHLFDRFWRSPSVKKKIPGSGLGLSIAHAIARAHHGDLTVSSRPGRTTFRLVLPTEQSAELKVLQP